MSEVFQFQGAEYSKVGKNNALDRVVVSYTLLKGPKKGETWKTGTLVKNLDEDSRTTLKALKPGDYVSLLIEKNEQGYKNINAVSPATEADAASQPTVAKSATTGSTFDNVGVKVGAARNQAIAFLSATQGDYTLDNVDEVAYEILQRQAKMEENHRKGINPFEEELANAETTNNGPAFDDVDDPDVPF